MPRSNPKSKLMSKDERDDALVLAQQVIGSRAAGRPIDDPTETAVRLARVTAQLCRHIEAAEELAAEGEAVAHLHSG